MSLSRRASQRPIDLLNFHLIFEVLAIKIKKNSNLIIDMIIEKRITKNTMKKKIVKLKKIYETQK